MSRNVLGRFTARNLYKQIRPVSMRNETYCNKRKRNRARRFRNLKSVDGMLIQFEHKPKGKEFFRRQMCMTVSYVVSATFTSSSGGTFFLCSRWSDRFTAAAPSWTLKLGSFSVPWFQVNSKHWFLGGHGWIEGGRDGQKGPRISRSIWTTHKQETKTGREREKRTCNRDLQTLKRSSLKQIEKYTRLD